MSDPLAEVVEAVLRRAQKQGHVLPSEIRAELKAAGLAEECWKDVVAQTKTSLHYRQGRYYHVTTVSPRLHQEQEHQRAIAKVIRQLVKQHRQAMKDHERRGQERYDFIHPVKVQLDDGKTHQLLSRDVSVSGIRLLGTQRFLGKKLRVYLPGLAGAAPTCLLVRVLWTCAVGDDLFENGGNFLEVVPG
jgi:hypothetical protein